MPAPPSPRRRGPFPAEGPASSREPGIRCEKPPLLSRSVRNEGFSHPEARNRGFSHPIGLLVLVGKFVATHRCWSGLFLIGNMSKTALGGRRFCVKSLDFWQHAGAPPVEACRCPATGSVSASRRWQRLVGDVAARAASPAVAPPISRGETGSAFPPALRQDAAPGEASPARASGGLRLGGGLRLPLCGGERRRGVRRLTAGRLRPCSARGTWARG